MSNVTLLDGAVGTSLWAKSGDQLPVWRYNMENPGIVTELAGEYVSAGSQIVLANTFAINAISLKNSPYQPAEVVARAVELAKDGVKGQARVALSVGPLPILLEPYGDLTEDEAHAMFLDVMTAGVQAGADIVFAQTFMDLAMMQVALRAAFTLGKPVFAAFSFEQRGRTLMGNAVPDIVQELAAFPLDAIGLNCSLGPEQALPVLTEFKNHTDLPLLFKPNAGLPVAGGAAVDAEAFADAVAKAADIGATYIGGCCGSSPLYIQALRSRLR